MKSKTISKPRWIFPGLMVLALSLILAACTTPGTPAPTGDPVEQAMQTLQAQATQEYYQTVVAQLTATSPVIENTPTLNSHRHQSYSGGRRLHLRRLQKCPRLP